jgi:hypothetical protein
VKLKSHVKSMEIRVKTEAHARMPVTFHRTLVVVNLVSLVPIAKHQFHVHRRHVKTMVFAQTPQTFPITLARVRQHTPALTVKRLFHVRLLRVKTLVPVPTLRTLAITPVLALLHTTVTIARILSHVLKILVKTLVAALTLEPAPTITHVPVHQRTPATIVKLKCFASRKNHAPTAVLVKTL